MKSEIEKTRGIGEKSPFQGLMEISGKCGHFVRRNDFDAFSMADYNSCENCRNLGSDDKCRRPQFPMDSR